jgi:YjbE family integral membrane protein
LVTDLFTNEAVVAFIQVVVIDLVLAGDNAVVIGLAAAGLPSEQRTRAILIGIVGATILRIVLAGLTTQLLQIVGLLFAGGILLLWVCWKIWRELRSSSIAEQETLDNWDISRDGTIAGRARRKSFGQAALQIVAADVSMSLDNVLAVAGAAREHPIVLAFGLVLSITLMGVAANWVARLLQKHRWIAYAGLAIIFYVACQMIYRGAHELKPVINMASTLLE